MTNRVFRLLKFVQSFVNDRKVVLKEIAKDFKFIGDIIRIRADV